jgi:hypothetical protein
MSHVSEVATGTLFPKADSWYGAVNIAGKPRMFISSVGGCGAAAWQVPRGRGGRLCGVCPRRILSTVLSNV